MAKHRLSNIDSIAFVADCEVCGPDVPIHQEGRGYRCRTGRLGQQRTFLRGSRYGLDDTSYNMLFEMQQGRCAICGIHQDDHATSLHIDHDHSSGEVRGLLCHQCNRALGLLGDDVDRLLRAASYLTQKGVLPLFPRSPVRAL